ncbi:hypothetical protein [Mucilaginibacter sp.]
MLKKLPVKKEYLLLIATILLLLVSYQLAFKKTIAAWQLNNSLEKRLPQSNDLTIQPDYLERKNKNLDKLIGLYKADTTALRNNMINIVSLLADKEGVKLSEVPVQDIANISDHFIIERLRFEGDYFALMKLSDRLGQESGIGMVRSEILKVTEVNTSSNKIKKLGLEVMLEMVK